MAQAKCSDDRTRNSVRTKSRAPQPTLAAFAALQNRVDEQRQQRRPPEFRFDWPLSIAVLRAVSVSTWFTKGGDR